MLIIQAINSYKSANDNYIIYVSQTLSLVQVLLKINPEDKTTKTETKTSENCHNHS